MKYVFGPVMSRRLGRSLGVDPIPLKTCNWNCVYCQLGRTRPLTNTRQEYLPTIDILGEIEVALTSYQPGEIDWITFVGSGEPSLHNGLGRMIRHVKAHTNLPVAVITNGSLFFIPKMRVELVEADAVLPTLDAGNARLYRKINRPWPKITFNRQVDGLASFRQEFQGKLWLEVMLLRGLNDTVEALQEIAAIVKRVRPDQVHLLLPVRPPAEDWVLPTDEAGIQRAQAILGEVSQVILPNLGRSITSSTDDLESAILGIITRHPMQIDELSAALGGCPSAEILQILEKLQASQKAQRINRHNKQFWSAAGAFYAETDPSTEARRHDIH